MRGATDVDSRHRALDIAAVVGLLVLILLVFWRIGPAGRVLAGGDLFTYFYPYWSEATRALRAGRLPLWNPHLFMGVPLLANSQVGTLYPLNWPLWFLLPPHRSLHWSVILHLCLAATGTYVYARTSLRLGRVGAWTAGAALALGGYLGAQVEHVNQLQALAWFPWLLTLYDWALARRAVCAFAGLAAPVGLTLLAGHTQSAFIMLTGLAVYALVPRRGGNSPSLKRRATVWIGAVALGAVLAAAQLVPTFELARLSVRARGLPFNERVSFSLSPPYLARALLPGYGDAVEPENVEYVATVGVVGLLLVAVCSWSLLRRGRDDAEGSRDRVWGVFLLAALGLFLALGLYNPLYLLLARFVPGFAHFRAPARWLALWAFGGAALVGAGVERVAHGQARLTRSAWIAGGVGLAAVVIWGMFGHQCGPMTMAAWLAAGLSTAGLLWLSGRMPRTAGLGLAILLAVELILSGRTLPHAQATAPQSYTSLRPAAAHLVAAGEGRRPADRFLSLSALVFDPGDLEELHLIYGGQLSPDALYNLVVSAKHREVLSPNLALALGIPAVDGYDGGVLPLARYLALQRAFLPEEEVSLDGRLRENLTRVPDGRWLSLFNVRHVITDKVFDAWLDDVFYDLQFEARLAEEEVAQVAYIPSFETTALGVVSYLDGASALTDETLVGEVTVGFADGVTHTFPLRAGVETAEGLYGPEVAHAQADVGGHFWPGQPEGTDYVTRLRWDEAAVPTSVSVRAVLPQGQLVVRGVSLIDERTGSFQSLVLSDRGRFRPVHSGDVKVYENLNALGRAFVVHRAWAAASEEEAVERMQAADFDPSAEVVVESGGRAAPLPGNWVDPEEVRVVSYVPERVEVEVDLAAPGYLVLTDANYPGWHAWVDGEEVEVLTADLLFRAVRLEAGTHRVVFAFRSMTARIGAAISLSGMTGLLGLLAVHVYNWGADAANRVRRRRRGA